MTTKPLLLLMLLSRRALTRMSKCRASKSKRRNKPCRLSKSRSQKRVEHSVTKRWQMKVQKFKSKLKLERLKSRRKL